MKMKGGVLALPPELIISHLDFEPGPWPNHLASTVNDGLADSSLVKHWQLHGDSREKVPLVDRIRQRLRSEGILWLPSCQLSLAEVRKALEHMPQAVQRHEDGQDDGNGDHAAKDGYVQLVKAAIGCEGVQQHASSVRCLPITSQPSKGAIAWRRRIFGSLGSPSD